MHQLPETMKSPRDTRPSIWLGGVLQIAVTRSCDLACVNCTQGSNFKGKKWMMSVDQYRTAVISLMRPRPYFGVIGMFGGNPALHPQFDELCRILKEETPFQQRGLWCNHPRGHGKQMRVTFNPKHSNLNVHLVREAYDEFWNDWPECRPYLKGLDPEWPEAKRITHPHLIAAQVGDARHSPSYGPSDLDEEARWAKIARCDVNQYWSAIINVFRGELRGFFCEIAGAMSVLHQDDQDTITGDYTWPDAGYEVIPGWWDQPMQAFDAQVRQHCHNCSFPERGLGDLAVGGTTNQVSPLHAAVCIPKSKDQLVQIVNTIADLHPGSLKRGTDYVENGKV